MLLYLKQFCDNWNSSLNSNFIIAVATGLDNNLQRMIKRKGQANYPLDLDSDKLEACACMSPMNTVIQHWWILITYLIFQEKNYIHWWPCPRKLWNSDERKSSRSHSWWTFYFSSCYQSTKGRLKQGCLKWFYKRGTTYESVWSS